MKTECYNKIVCRRKEELKKYFTPNELAAILKTILAENNIKYKNEESKIIKNNLFTLKLSNINETKIRAIFYQTIEDNLASRDVEIHDLTRILDAVLINYKGINNIKYLYINL